uniref:Uncharacterized protein n=1 Tax=Avena sativa TaxID=4498 RepID=A0ACD5V747_AVESA
MEMKKMAAAIAVVYVLLMLSGQLQQVAAMSEFCECYKHCYPLCRQDLPPWACFLFCIELECRPIPTGVAGSSATCRTACGLDNLCGLSAMLPDDAAACVSDCKEKRSR